MKDEFNQPREYEASGEYNEASEYNTEKYNTGEYNTGSQEGLTQKKSGSKVRKMVYLVTAVLSVTVLTHAVDPDFSLLGGLNRAEKPEDEPNKPHVTGSALPGKDQRVQDDFPVLQNLWPNGEVPEYGVLDEEYVYLRTGDEIHYLYIGKKYQANGTRVEEYEGADYNPDTNTLTIRNVTADQLNVNMMGNGFSVKVEGENNISQVLVWGFFYGGSVTFLGDGVLKIDGEYGGTAGLDLPAEVSTTCIMVEKGVTLDITGHDAAVIVRTTDEEKGLYLRSHYIYGGHWKKIDSKDGYYTYSFVDENGDLVKHIYISPEPR